MVGSLRHWPWRFAQEHALCTMSQLPHPLYKREARAQPQVPGTPGPSQATQEVRLPARLQHWAGQTLRVPCRVRSLGRSDAGALTMVCVCPVGSALSPSPVEGTRWHQHSSVHHLASLTRSF